MNNKNIAFYLSETFKELKFLNQKFNLKLLNSKEQAKMSDSYENPYGDGTYNPFGEPPFWIEIRKFKIKDVNPNYKGYSIIYKKIFNCDDFKLISIDGSCNEFEYNFYEEASVSHRPKNQIIKTPRIEIWDFGDKEQEYIGDYLRRLKGKFEVDFIYMIIFKISNTLEVEYDCKELKHDFILKKINPDSPPIRIWKEKSVVRDKNNLAQLKKLVVDVCEQLEERKIHNYIIVPDTILDDLYIAMERADSESWGNYDPF
jgi:hypothetical protein